MTDRLDTDRQAGPPARWALAPGRGPGEAGGAFGDLGTLLPYVLGLVAAGAVAPAAAFAGFGIAYLVTGWLYALPIAVQPMKAVAAVILTQGMTPAEVAAAGIVLGAVLIVLGATGAIERIARVLPQSVVAGLQLGLGLSLGLLALSMMAEGLAWGVGGLAGLLLLGRIALMPAALVVVVAGGLLSAALGSGPDGVAAAAAWHGTVLPGLADFATASVEAVLPQLPLTLTNAVIVTAALARELFADGAGRASERRLALSSGALNLVLAPLGALPMCHGAGGLAAHHRFGARSGLALYLLGGACLVLALLPGEAALAVLGAIPRPLLGALLLVTAAQLAMSRRLFDARPSCQAVIAATGLVCLVWGPAVALAAGWPLEIARQWLFARVWRGESA